MMLGSLKNENLSVLRGTWKMIIKIIMGVLIFISFTKAWIHVHKEEPYKGQLFMTLTIVQTMFLVNL